MYAFRFSLFLYPHAEPWIFSCFLSGIFIRVKKCLMQLQGDTFCESFHPPRLRIYEHGFSWVWEGCPWWVLNQVTYAHVWVHAEISALGPNLSISAVVFFHHEDLATSSMQPSCRIFYTNCTIRGLMNSLCSRAYTWIKLCRHSDKSNCWW